MILLGVKIYISLEFYIIIPARILCWIARYSGSFTPVVNISQNYRNISYLWETSLAFAIKHLYSGWGSLRIYSLGYAIVRMISAAILAL